MNYENDIPLDLARNAHRGTSFAPETRAAQEITSYAAQLRADRVALEALADTDEKRAALDAEFHRYREGFRDRTIAMLAAKGRCLSTMIAGPSRFNVSRANKASEAADNRTRDLLEYRERALAAIRKVLRPELRPIMSGDDDAADRLADKIAKLKAAQEGMRAVNATIRKYAKSGAEAQVAALVGLDGCGISEERARELLKPDFCGRVGFAPYELTNNAANIRRLEARLEAVQRAKAAPVVETDGTKARVEDVPAENRVRIYFPGKPDGMVRNKLKAHGFRWTPSIEAWQAYRNDNTIAIAREVAGVHVVHCTGGCGDIEVSADCNERCPHCSRDLSTEVST